MDAIEITEGTDVLLLLIRCTFGVVIFLHGYNHLWGAGGVEGTTRWFASLGFRPAKLHALMSGVVEIAIAVGFVLGLLTPVAAAALVGTMVAAGWTDHRPNGFFMFKQGYEYVLVYAVSAVFLATTGPGTLSLDSVLGIVDYGDPTSPGLLGLTGGLIALAVGVVSGAGLLVVGWRPVPRVEEKAEEKAA